MRQAISKQFDGSLLGIDHFVQVIVLLLQVSHEELEVFDPFGFGFGHKEKLRFSERKVSCHEQRIVPNAPWMPTSNIGEGGGLVVE